MRLEGSRRLMSRRLPAVRFTATELERLCELIEAHGQKDALLVALLARLQKLKKQ